MNFKHFLRGLKFSQHLPQVPRSVCTLRSPESTIYVGYCSWFARVLNTSNLQNRSIYILFFLRSFSRRWGPSPKRPWCSVITTLFPGFVGHRLFGCSSFASKPPSFLYKKRECSIISIFFHPQHTIGNLYGRWVLSGFFSGRVTRWTGFPIVFCLEARRQPLTIFIFVLCHCCFLRHCLSPLYSVPFACPDLNHTRASWGNYPQILFLISHNLQLNFRLQFNIFPGFHTMESISSRPQIS